MCKYARTGWKSARVRRDPKDTQVVDLGKLDHSPPEDGEAFMLELVTSLVHRPEYPETNNVNESWWWSVNRSGSSPEELGLLRL